MVFVPVPVDRHRVGTRTRTVAEVDPKRPLVESLDADIGHLRNIAHRPSDAPSTTAHRRLGYIQGVMPRIRAATIAEHKRQTREEILDAAAALFRAQGYGDTALGDIAGYVGLGRTTLYEYFVDKEDLLVHLVERSLPAVVDEMVDGLPDGLSYRERLGELVVRGLEFVSSDADLGSTLMRELPKLSPEAQLRVRAAHSRLEDEVARLCRLGIGDGEFGPYDPADASRIVFLMMMSTSHSLLRDRDAKQRVHEVADTLVRFIFDGLSSE